LANTINHFGINMANTVYVNPVKATSKIFDVDWETVEETPKKEKKFINFSFQPLEYVCARIRNGIELYTIAEELKLGGDTTVVLLAEDTDRANRIYTYFQNKHILRRLKGEYISNFMIAVENLCENKFKIDEEHLPVLLTLPRFYEQNLHLENIMKRGVSVDRNKTTILTPFEKTLEYVDCINIINKKHNSNHYFWKTDENHLVRVVIKAHDVSNAAWRCLAKQKRVKVKTSYTGLSNIQGYDYHVYHLGSDAEVEAL
jgi:hypothetical protein